MIPRYTKSKFILNTFITRGSIMSRVSLKGICDMHVHTNPDLRLRAYNDLELADAAVRVGARALGDQIPPGLYGEPGEYRQCLCEKGLWG